MNLFADKPDWIFEVVILLIVALLLFIFKKPLSKAIWHFALSYWRREDKEIYLSMREPLIKPLGILLPLIILNVALEQVEVIPEPYFSFLLKLFNTIVAMVALWLLIRVVTSIGIVMVKNSEKQDKKISVSAVSLLASTLRVVVIIIGLFIIISFWVDNLAGVIAGVGIGGLAIALAAQETISNAFASLMILFDQPFDIGDWIDTPDVSGTVEFIGLRSTKVRAMDESLVTVPNNKLASDVIANGTLRSKRRVEMTLVLSWTESFARMKKFRLAIMDLLKNHEGVEDGTYLVYFSDLPSEGAHLSLYYYGTADYTENLKLKSDINLKILDLAKEYNISLSIPTIYCLDELENLEEGAAQ